MPPSWPPSPPRGDAATLAAQLLGMAERPGVEARLRIVEAAFREVAEANTQLDARVVAAVERLDLAHQLVEAERRERDDHHAAVRHQLSQLRLHCEGQHSALGARIACVEQTLGGTTAVPDNAGLQRVAFEDDTPLQLRLRCGPVADRLNRLEKTFAEAITRRTLSAESVDDLHRMIVEERVTREDNESQRVLKAREMHQELVEAASRKSEELAAMRTKLGRLWDAALEAEDARKQQEADLRQLREMAAYDLGDPLLRDRVEQVESVLAKNLRYSSDLEFLRDQHTTLAANEARERQLLGTTLERRITIVEQALGEMEGGFTTDLTYLNSRLDKMRDRVDELGGLPPRGSVASRVLDEASRELKDATLRLTRH